MSEHKRVTIILFLSAKRRSDLVANARVLCCYTKTTQAAGDLGLQRGGEGEKPGAAVYLFLAGS